MSRALDIPALRAEWRMSRALKNADLNGIVAGDAATDQASTDAIQSRHDERTKATLAAIIGAENKALTIRDAWAILNLALAVADDDEKREAARPLLEKAERVLKALRDAKAEQAETVVKRNEGDKLASSYDGLSQLEDPIRTLASLARVAERRLLELPTEQSSMSPHELEEHLRDKNDVATLVCLVSERAEEVEKAFDAAWNSQS